MNEIIYGIVQVRLNFALEVFFSVYCKVYRTALSFSISFCHKNVLYVNFGWTNCTYLYFWYDQQQFSTNDKHIKDKRTMARYTNDISTNDRRQQMTR